MSRLILLAVLFLTPVQDFAADPVQLDGDGDPIPEGAVARYGSTRLRHPIGMPQLAFSRDGTLLASIGGHSDQLLARLVSEGSFFPPTLNDTPNMVAIVWDTSTGKAKARYKGKNVVAGDFGADGTLYLAGSDPTCLAMDLRTGKTRSFANLMVKNETRNAKSICVSPDGQTIALGCDKGLIVWLDAATGKERGRLERRNLPDITALVYSGDGRTIAARGGTCDVFLVDARQFKAVRSYAIGGDRSLPCMSLAINHDGTRLVSVVSDNESGTRIREFEANSDDEPVGFVAPQSDAVALGLPRALGSILAVTTQGNLVRWNASDGKEEANWKLQERVSAAAFDAEGKQVAVADEYGMIRLYSSATGKRRLPNFATTPIVLAQFGPRDANTIHTFDASGRIAIWNLNSGRIQKSIALPEGACISPTMDRAAVWSEDRSLFRILDLPTQKELWRSPGAEYGVCMSFSPDGHSIAVARGQAATIEIWDVARARLKITIRPKNPTEMYVGPPTWSPDSRCLATVEGERDSERAIISTGLGNQVIMAENNRTLAIWEAATGQLRWSKKIAVLFDRSAQPCWTNGGSRLALAQDRVLRIHQIGRDEPLTEFLIPSFPTVVASSRDDHWLAIGFRNGEIHLWESTGSGRRVAAGHSGSISSLVFSADSKQLLSGCSDGTALLWDIGALPRWKPQPNPPIPPLNPQWCWTTLSGANAKDLLGAFDAMAKHPAESLDFLKGRLKPIAKIDPKQIEELIAQLGEARFDVREKAERALTAMGEQAEPALRAAISKSPGAETKKRIELLLKATEGTPASPDMLRQIRCIELLERIRTPAALELLQALAEGDPNARQTKEAISALGRWPRN